MVRDMTTARDASGASEPVSLRQRKKARTRAALIASAMELFERQGYEATTIDDITAAADVSPRTFFRYFSSKEEVALGDDLGPAMVALLRSRPAGESILESLRHVVAGSLALLSEDDRAALLSRLRLVYRTPSLRARRWEFQLDMGRISGAVLAERRGLPSGDLGSRVAATAGLMAVEVGMDHWQQHDGREDLNEVLQTAIDRLRDAYRDEPERIPRLR
jgi:AcrR family transcriptional regulator